MFKIGKKRLYLDYASLTPISKGVQREVSKYMTDSFANPSSIHKEGLFAKRVLSNSRDKVAKSIKAHSDEIIFTGSGTESNNIAILGLAEEKLGQGIEYKYQHYITSAIEHSSVLETFKTLEKRGAKVSYISVNENGEIDLNLLKKSINKDTVLVSVMMVNNETGVIEKIRDISKIVRDYNKANLNSRVLLHTDASQAFLYLDIDVSKTNIDLLTLDAHKVYGPRGVGMLYIKRGVKISPIIFGGGQESNIRSGTENVPGIAGLTFALEEAEKNRKKESERILKIRNSFEEKLLAQIPEVKIISRNTERSPHISSIIFPKIDNEYFVLLMDANGVALSTKSSCLRDAEESYVLNALNISKEEQKRAVRFSFGSDVSIKDIPFILKIINKCYNFQYGTSK